MFGKSKSTLSSLFLIVFINLCHFSTIVLAGSGGVYKNPNHFVPANFFRLNSIKCVEEDPSFVRFEECYIKPINRFTKSINVRATLLQKPVVSIGARIRTFKRANGYKPFVINADWDICKLLAGKRDVLFKFAYNIIAPFTNVNHSCPYNHDIIVYKLPFYNITLPSVFPEGDYRLNIQLDTFGIPRGTVMISVTMEES